MEPSTLKRRTRSEIITLLKGTNRKGIDAVCQYLVDSDYFSARCYSHHRFNGGLAVHSLGVYKEFKKLDLEGKCEKMTALLEKLATEGTEERPYPLIIKESIYAGRDTVSYKHNCGIGSAVMLKPFDKRMN